MKNKVKLFSIMILAVFLVSACSNQAGEKEEKKYTSITVKNSSTVNIQLMTGTSQEEINNKKDLSAGSEIIFSEKDGDTISEGSKYFYCQINRSDALSMESEPVMCQIAEALNIVKNENATLNITDNTLVIDIFDSNNKGTVLNILTSPVLTIKNSSSYDFYGVNFLKEEFFSEAAGMMLEKNAEDKHAIYDETTGKRVNTENGYLYFSRDSDKASFRTKNTITVKRGKIFSFEIKDDTEVVEINNETNTGTLGTIEKKLVFYESGDDEELKQFTSIRNASAQHLQPEAIAEGELHETYLNMEPNGMLSFTVNMEKDGKLSFWYKSPYISDDNSYFLAVTANRRSIIQIRRNFMNDWTLCEVNLESGKNEIKIFNSIEDVSFGGNNLYLDDILILYTE